MNQNDILERLREMLLEAFEIEPARVQLDTHLFTDLELDSIDAVDLAIKVQELTGKRIKPEAFKTVRTVRDVVHAIENLMAA